MQRVTHLPGTLWFGLKSRHWVFRLWDTSGPVKPHLTALCRLLTLLVQAMPTSQGSFVSAQGCCRHSCFCLPVTYDTPIQPYFLVSWNLKEWLRVTFNSSRSAGKIFRIPKAFFPIQLCLHGEGEEVQLVLQDILTPLSGDACGLLPSGQDQDRMI